MGDVMNAALIPLLLLLGVGASGALQSAPDPGACPVSPLITASAPSETGADPIIQRDWYMNAGRTIWAGPVPNDGWFAGTIRHSYGETRGNKTYWVRPRGTQLAITGRRLDATAPPAEVYVPCCFTKGFQIAMLRFPTEGCWEVSARSGDSELTFVTQVRPTPQK
jgi:hypothetical protein